MASGALCLLVALVVTELDHWRAKMRAAERELRARILSHPPTRKALRTYTDAKRMVKALETRALEAVR